MTQKDMNNALRSALAKYALDAKNPTGADLPKSLTAEKPPAMGINLLKPSPSVRPPQPLAPPQPTGMASAQIGPAGKPAGNNAIFAQAPAARPTPTQLPQDPSTTTWGYMTGRNGLRKDVGDYFTHQLPATWAPGSEAYQSADARYKNLPNDRALLSGSRFAAGTAAAGATTLGAVAALPAAAAAGVPGAATLSAATGAPAAWGTGAAAASMAPTAIEYAANRAATPATPQPEQAPQPPQPEQAQPATPAQPTRSSVSGIAAAAQSSQQRPAITPAALDLKSQDALAADLQKLPPEQAKVKAQEGVQAHFQALPEEEQKGVQDVIAGNTDTPEAKQFEAKVEGPVKEQYVKDEYAKQVAENPNVTTQQAGGIMNGIMEGWNNMPNEMKWMMGIGLGGGLLGILGSMFGGGGGMGLMGLLGLGAAGLAGAAGGMFGPGAQDALGGMVGQLGQATGMIPKDMDLSALKGNDAIERATQKAQGGGWRGAWNAWRNPEGEAAKVKGQLGQADQLNRLMMVPEGMRPGLLRQISPNSSPQEIQQMLANAKQMHGAINDPKSQLGQRVQEGRAFVKDPSAYVNNAASEYYNPAKWDVMPWNWGGKSSADHGLVLAQLWAKEAEDKDIKEWLQKFRARGQKGRWVNTRRSSRTEQRVMCHN